MWVLLNDCFVSIVAHRDKPEMLLVRARRKGDLEKLLGKCKVRKTPDADYLYRAEVTRARMAGIMADAVADIGYDNFKNSVPDDRLHSAYASIWSTLHRLQQ